MAFVMDGRKSLVVVVADGDGKKSLSHAFDRFLQLVMTLSRIVEYLIQEDG